MAPQNGEQKNTGAVEHIQIDQAPRIRSWFALEWHRGAHGPLVMQLAVRGMAVKEDARLEDSKFLMEVGCRLLMCLVQSPSCCDFGPWLPVLTSHGNPLFVPGSQHWRC